MALFTSGGLELAYDDSGPNGDGPCMVLVHGFSSNRRENWKRLGWYDALNAKRIRCVAFDCRGHGESAKPHDPALYGRADMARDAFALMDALDIRRAHLMGFSMGAHLALAATLIDPSRVRRLILGGVGATLLAPEPPDDRMARAMEAEDAATIDDPMLRSFRHFADEQREDRLALAACSRGARFPVDRAALATVAAPTLVVAGARDALAGPPGPLAQAIPGAHAETLPGCDHFSAIAHALFKATVFDFLDGYIG